ncbi:NXPE family member 3-like isoform X2 [Sardina pilchardus]
MWSFIYGDIKGDGPLPRPAQQQQQRLADTSDMGLNRTQTLQIPEDLGFSTEEWGQIQRALHWGEPDRQITTATMSTSPEHSTFVIDDFKNSYYVGEELRATIVAKDCTGSPKRYGGDFFQAKVYSDALKASVFGEVLDHQNGTYSARFTLPWAGQALVAVRLVHSSEGVQVLRRHRDTDPDRLDYNGVFVGKDPQGAQVEETVVCNVKWEGVVLAGEGDCCCEYQDVRTGLTWQCREPQTLPCDALVHHSMAGWYKTHMTAIEQALMNGRFVNRSLKGDSRRIRVVASNATIGVRGSCKPGMPTPIPAGFYMNDVWTSFVCATRHFSVQDSTQCLRNKHIYIMGDSTSRQWFEHLLKAVPTLKRMNLHTEHHNGPHTAVDLQNNIDLHYRSHGLPRRSPKGPITAMHYISNEIHDMAGGPNTVFIFNVWAHFTHFRLSFFAHRVSQIRRAVLALLKRAPETKVIIKTANTGPKDIHRSDWLAMQLDQILREAFRNVNVYILDVWQMTACHYNVEELHPAPVILKNQIDILLSFICPT